MEYDQECLVVWPEWASSGIWHPKDRNNLSGPVSCAEAVADHVGSVAEWFAFFRGATSGASDLLESSRSNADSRIALTDAMA